MYFYNIKSFNVYDIFQFWILYFAVKFFAMFDTYNFE